MNALDESAQKKTSQLVTLNALNTSPQKKRICLKNCVPGQTIVCAEAAAREGAHLYEQFVFINFDKPF